MVANIVTKGFPKPKVQIDIRLPIPEGTLDVKANKLESKMCDLKVRMYKSIIGNELPTEIGNAGTQVLLIANRTR